MHAALRTFLYLFTLAILVIGCAPQATTASPATVTPSEIIVLTPLPTKQAHPVVTPRLAGDAPLALRQKLADQYGIRVDDITLLEMREEVWQDGCLGAALPGEMCTQAIVPGYLIFFETPNGKIEVHTDQDMNFFRVVPSLLNTSGLLVVWTRSGGIAGICWQMSIFLDGSYQLLDCISQQTLAQGSLPVVTLDELLALTEGMMPHEWATPQLQGADMFNDSYAWYGPGNGIPEPQTQEQLNSLLSSLASQLVK